MKKSKADLKFTLQRLYDCRNLEISNLWQRSVFLSVFLILTFSAYGYLVLDFITELAFKKNELDKKIISSTICIFIISIGIIFSVVWILMAKGSKAWYEVYETAIAKFEYDYWKKLKIPNSNIMGNMVLDPSRKSSNVFSTKAGAFSPSRINIAIGQISLIIWILIDLIHYIYNFIMIRDSENYHYFILVNFALFISSIAIILFLICSKYIRSTFH